MSDLFEAVQRTLLEISRLSITPRGTTDRHAAIAAIAAGNRALGAAEGMLTGMIFALNEPEKAHTVVLELSESMAQANGMLCAEMAEHIADERAEAIAHANR